MIARLSKSQKRHLEIITILREKKICLVYELANTFCVSENTMRRDLSELEKQGFVHRLHGSVRIVESENSRLGFTKRHEMYLAEKRSIAREALSRIPESTTTQTVLVDAGSTCFELLRLLEKREHIAIMTPSLAVLELPGLLNSKQVVLIGGLLDTKSYTSCGIPAENFLDQYSVDIAFLGITAISEEGDYYINNFNEVGIKQKMLSVSKIKIGLADSSKWNKTGIAHIGNIRDLDEVISYKGQTSKNSLLHEYQGSRQV